jgi:hypothetical protein
MAVLHRAFRFDPESFRELLRQHAAPRDRLDAAALSVLGARAIAPGASTPASALEAIRYDPEWLEDPAGLSPSQAWVLALVQTLAPVHNLSHRHQASWRVLKQGLPACGWTPEEVELLLQGEPLSRFMASEHWWSSAPRELDQYGGWLSPRHIAELSRRLESTGLSRPGSPAIPVIARIATQWSQPPELLLAAAAEDAGDMLRAAADGRSALYMVLD